MKRLQHSCGSGLRRTRTATAAKWCSRPPVHQGGALSLPSYGSVLTPGSTRCSVLLRSAGFATQTPAEDAPAAAERPNKKGSLRSDGLVWDSDNTWQKKKNPSPTFRPEQVVTRAQLKEMIATNAAVLLDLRSPGECKVEPGIPSAINISADDFMRTIVLDDAKWRARYGFAKPQKDTRLVLYTSPEDLPKLADVLNFLAEQGHTSLQVALGGAREWNKYENANF